MLLRDLEGRAWELQYCERNFTFCLKHRTRAQETSSILGSRTNFQKPLSIFLLQPSHRCEGRRCAFPLYPSRQCRSAKCEQSAPHPIARLQQAAPSISCTPARSSPQACNTNKNPTGKAESQNIPSWGYWSIFQLFPFPTERKLAFG